MKQLLLLTLLIQCFIYADAENTIIYNTYYKDIENSIPPYIKANFDPIIYKEAKLLDRSKGKIEKDSIENYFSKSDNYIDVEANEHIVNVVTTNLKLVRFVSFRISLAYGDKDFIGFIDTLVASDSLRGKNKLSNFCNKLFSRLYDNPDITSKARVVYDDMVTVKYAAIVNDEKQRECEDKKVKARVHSNPAYFDAKSYSRQPLEQCVYQINAFIDSLILYKRSNYSFINVQNFKFEDKILKSLEQDYKASYYFFAAADTLARYVYQTTTPRRDKGEMRYWQKSFDNIKQLVAFSELNELEEKEEKKWDGVGGFRTEVNRFVELATDLLFMECDSVKNQAEKLVANKHYKDAKLMYLRILRNCSDNTAYDAIVRIERLEYQEQKIAYKQIDEFVASRNHKMVAALTYKYNYPVSQLRINNNELRLPLTSNNLRLVLSKTEENLKGYQTIHYTLKDDGTKFEVSIMLDSTKSETTLIPKLTNFPLGKPTFRGIELYYQSIGEIVDKVSEMLINDNLGRKLSIYITGTADATPFKGSIANVKQNETFIYMGANEKPVEKETEKLDLTNSKDKNILLAFKRADGLREYLEKNKSNLFGKLGTIVYDSEGGDLRNVQCTLRIE